MCSLSAHVALPHVCKQSQPQEVRVGRGVKAGGCAHDDSERKEFAMWL